MSLHSVWRSRSPHLDLTVLYLDGFVEDLCCFYIKVQPSVNSLQPIEIISAVQPDKPGRWSKERSVVYVLPSSLIKSRCAWLSSSPLTVLLVLSRLQLWAGWVRFYLMICTFFYKVVVLVRGFVIVQHRLMCVCGSVLICPSHINTVSGIKFPPH